MGFYNCRRPAVIVGGIAFSMVVSGADAQQLEVAEHKCALRIENAEPRDIVPCNSITQVQPIYVWVLLKGDAAALKLLQSGSSLSISQKWKRWIAGAKTSTELAVADEEIPAGAISKDVANQLEQELKILGYFDWRTWTKKENLKRVSYSVNIVDRELYNVQCGAAPIAENPCVTVIVK